LCDEHDAPDIRDTKDAFGRLVRGDRRFVAGKKESVEIFELLGFSRRFSRGVTRTSGRKQLDGLSRLQLDPLSPLLQRQTQDFLEAFHAYSHPLPKEKSDSLCLYRSELRKILE